MTENNDGWRSINEVFEEIDKKNSRTRDTDMIDRLMRHSLADDDAGFMTREELNYHAKR